MFGDVAIAVNPNDKRYIDLIEATEIPISGKSIKIISDKYVDKDLELSKITPAHDFNDF